MNAEAKPNLPAEISPSLKWLCENGHALLASDGSSPPGLNSWQKALITQQNSYRGRLRRRFPDDANWLWTDMSLSQASDWWSAEAKAAMFPADVEVVDACCGAGIDAIALAARGAVHAIDMSADLAAITAANLRYAGKTGYCQHQQIQVSVGELPEAFPDDAQWMHADPDRRPQGRKSVEAGDFMPPMQSLFDLTERCRGSVIKIAPSTQFDDLLEERVDSFQRIWTGSFDQCRQQLLVAGECRRTEKDGQCAAMLCFPEVAEFWGVPTFDCDIETTPRKYIYELHPVLHAAELNESFANEHHLAALSDPRGYFSSDELVETPLLSAFELVDVIPWDDRKVRKWLRSNKVSTVEIKCRSAKVDANHFQRRYSSANGERPISLLVTTLDGRVRALACTRV